MKVNKHCKGCSNKNIESGWDAEEYDVPCHCTFMNQNKYGECPCSECLVKPTCATPCVDFNRWIMTSIKYEDTCYVLLQIDKIHPIAHKRHDLIWYPERGMTLLDCVQYKPYVKSVVTENPWIISCYDRDNVRVWHKEHGWVSPNNQTYGASVNGIMNHVLKIRQTIPAVALDGGTEIEKLITKLKDDRP